MTGTYVRNGETFNFSFGTDLSIADKQRFVNSVVDLLVNDEIKQYNSILRNLIVDLCTIKYFTDVDIDDLEQIDDIELFLEETNIIDIVKANVFPFIFEELNNAIDNSIAYITGIHTNPIGESIARLVDTLERKIGEIDLDGVMDMAQKFVGMSSEFTPESIVNAYINSDMHEKNLKEIADAKNIGDVE